MNLPRKIREEILVKMYGKTIVWAYFLNQKTNKEDEYLLWGSADIATILPITEKGKVITTVEFMQGANKLIHQLPGGLIDPKETPEAAVKRELLEETGYKAKRIIRLGKPVWENCRNSRTKTYLFLGLDCQKIQKPNPEQTEHISTRLIPLYKWMEKLQKTIEEPHAISATFRAQRHLKKFL